MKMNMKRTAALGLTVALSAACICGCGAEQKDMGSSANITDSESIEIMEAARTLLPAEGTTANAEKEETVYVVADASGNAEETIVSAWLKNPDGKDILSDYSTLSDIENIKGDESFTDLGNGQLSWQANGNDIYYQGTSSAELPVTTKVSYRLDGKEMEAADLAGKSGHLAITFSYTNHESRTASVNGETVNIYEPFLVISGLMFDNSKASGIQISNGKLINTGDATIAVGYALPGIKSSLGITEAKAEDLLPESLTIEADVTDFSLLTTLTVIDNSLLNDLELDHVESLEDLKAAMGSLSDASKQLVDGSGKLYDGVQELSDKAPALTDGIGQIEAGAGQLAGGSAQLKDGLCQLSEGTKNLPDSVNQLYLGTLQVSNALKTDLYGGAESIGLGAQQIAQGSQGIMQGADSISQGAGQIEAAAGALQSEMGNMSESMNNLLPLLEQYPELYAQLAPTLQEYQGKIQTAQAVLGQIQQGASGISYGAKSGDCANPGIYEAAGGIAQGADTISQGARAMQSGIDVITNDSNLGAISSGLYQLKESAGVMNESIGQLAEGSGKLADGAGALQDGASQLRNGSDTLVSGTEQLLEGAKQLKDGMLQFDQEGIDKLASYVNGDAAGLIERLKALKAASEEYTSFSGKCPAASGKVQFVIRTDSIGE